MREILFRGKRKDNGEWIEGFYQPVNNQPEKAFIGWYERTDQIIPSIRGVIPETVGQYTGLIANGKRIFEGDIVKCKDHLEAKPFEFQGYIDFKNGSFVIVGDFMTHYRWLDYEVEVIGNIHDNPELLKEGVEE